MKIYCKICSPKDLGLAWKYFAIGSRVTHLRSQTHQKSILDAQTAEAERAMCLREQEKEKASQAWVGPALLTDVIISNEPGNCARNLASLAAPLNNGNSFWTNTDYNLGPDSEVTIVHEQDKLEQEIERVMTWCDNCLASAVASNEVENPEKEEQWQIENEAEQVMSELISDAGMH